MNPWIHIGHMPLLALLVIAATACLILAGELYPGGVAKIARTAPRGRHLVYALGGLILLMAATVIMLLIFAFIGFGFGPFYMLVAIAFVMFIAIPVLAVPRFSRLLESFSQWQLIWRAAAVIVMSLVLAIVYVIVAILAGLPLQFGA